MQKLEGAVFSELSHRKTDTMDFADPLAVFAIST